MAFFGNSLVGYNIMPQHLILLTEISIYLLFIISLLNCAKYKKKISFDLAPLFFFLIFVGILSAISNNYLTIRIILSLRTALRFYIFYLALINLNIDEQFSKKINNILFTLFVIQIPVAAIKFYFYGVSEETIGTYAVVGGGNTTIIPLLCLAYLFSYYSFYKKRIIYIILGFGFIIYGLIGAKAALLFLIPLALAGLYYLNYIKGKGFNFVRDFATIFLIVIVSATIVVAYVKYQPRLNPEKKIGGSFNLKYAYNYAKKYTTGESYKERNIEAEHAAGRIATTKLALSKILNGGFVQIFFGYGPGIMTASALDEKAYMNPRIMAIKKSYGHTGAIYVFVEYGFLGFFIFFAVYSIFIIRCYKLFKKEKDPYWKAFSSGSFAFAILYLFIYVAYNTEPVRGDVIPPVYYYIMAMQYHRKRNNMTRIIE